VGLPIQGSFPFFYGSIIIILALESSGLAYREFDLKCLYLQDLPTYMPKGRHGQATVGKTKIMTDTETAKPIAANRRRLIISPQPQNDSADLPYHTAATRFTGPTVDNYPDLARPLLEAFGLGPD
jgi:hypothetical protein